MTGAFVQCVICSEAFVTAAIQLLSTRIVPMYDLENYFSCDLWAYIMHISSSVRFKYQF